jgi:hypothetical protein
MRFIVIQTTFAALVQAACQPNNCIRAVTGTRADQQASRRADCSSFMEVALTPATFTTTVTQTSTSLSTISTIGSTATVLTTTTETYVPVNKQKAKRQVTSSATAVPSYASVCRGVAEYSSACSCWGITRTTRTAATPTSVRTVLISTTSTQTTTLATTTTSIKTATTDLCPTGQKFCGRSGCRNLRADPNNCGECGNVCASGVCANGFCTNCTPQTSW